MASLSSSDVDFRAPLECAKRDALFTMAFLTNMPSRLLARSVDARQRGGVSAAMREPCRHAAMARHAPAPCCRFFRAMPAGRCQRRCWFEAFVYARCSAFAAYAAMSAATPLPCQILPTPRVTAHHVEAMPPCYLRAATLRYRRQWRCHALFSAFRFFLSLSCRLMPCPLPPALSRRAFCRCCVC